MLLVIHALKVPGVSLTNILFPTAYSIVLLLSYKRGEAYSLEDMYYAWLVRRFVPLTAIVLLIVNLIAIFVFPEYKKTFVSALVIFFFVLYPVFAVLSELRKMRNLNAVPEYNKICKERFRAERKAGKSLLSFVWKANGRKLLMFILFCAGLALLVRLGYYVFLFLNTF